ncbi:MAG TPA: hypothetical protein HA340_03575 [Candidatus Thalassarchaeaceae archaeon]|nr:MAG TPA: hypothetical protein D7H97_03530 [Candidatus Poseidoniales archaeon]HIH83007.1 hypothetical protein [Candidatus Thalassarchaeaceae archaeon]|tara:strand:+ start:8190 stop:11780 length:3591 start_codon:yes stop_codon:yes gene_type:complete
MQEKRVLSRVLSIILICALFSPIFSILPTASADSETIYVDTQSCTPLSAPGDGSIEYPYCNISEAISSSSSGDTIIVASGDYVLNQPISITHPLTLKGVKYDISALNRSSGDVTESTIDVRNSNGAIVITSSDVVVAGFNIIGNENTRFGFSISGNDNSLSNIEIENNLIHGMAKKINQLRSTSWGILTEAKVSSNFTTNTLDGLHFHGNHIYDIGGYNNSIGLGISLHEVVSTEVGGGAIIENNKFSNINDGQWAGVPTPGMGVVAQEEVLIYPTDQQSGITLRNNEYNTISVGAALQISERGVFDEQNNNFQSVDVFMINVGHTTTVMENTLAPFAKATGRNLTIGIADSAAYFASPSTAVAQTLVNSESDSHNIILSGGVFNEDLIIAPSNQLSNLLITTTEGGNPTFTGGIHLLANYNLNNFTIEGLTIQGEATPGIAFNIESNAGLSDITINNMTINGGDAARSGIISSGLSGAITVENNNFNNLDGAYSYTTTPDGIDSTAGQISQLSFSNNAITGSSGSVRLTPVSGLISSSTVNNNVFTNSGSNSTPMLSISNIAILTLDNNNLHDLDALVGISIEDVRYLSVSENNLSGLNIAITVDESNTGSMQSATFDDNSFTEIDTYAIEVPTVTGATVSVNQNWFGTTNISAISEMIQGDTQIGEQWNSWPGEDTDNDGWADEFDLCSGHNDAVDVDADGIPDGCDSLIDSDDDSISDGVDNCLTQQNTDQANHDGDVYGDLCDSDDDNDGMLDTENGEQLDMCPQGHLGWVRTQVTDPDNDGCHNYHEDDDDDNDGILDDVDLCQRSIQLNWESNQSTDYDGDGCIDDSTEDNDDDNDNIDDDVDLCPNGELNWISIRDTDFDGDGCLDVLEDFDDDNDGVLDVRDDCPNQYVNNETDLDGDGCIDTNNEASSFTERLMVGEPMAMAIVMIPILLMFVVGTKLYVNQINRDTKNRLLVSVGNAETPRRLRELSNRANEIFLSKAITKSHHNEIQEAIEERRELFEESELKESEEIEVNLERVLTKAIALGLTTENAVKRMHQNIKQGKFEPKHYLDMWSERIDKDSSTTAPVEEDTTADDEELDSTPPLSKTSLSKLKKDELVALAKDRGMLTSGTKATIIDRLLEDEDIEEVTKVSTPVTSLSAKSELSKLKKDELVALAKERGMLTSGTKATLIERLLPGTTRTLGGEEE